MSERGKLFVVEGVEGAGKSVQAELLAKRLRESGRSVVEVREPGTTPMGQELRRILLDVKIGRTAVTNVLLFTAARFDLWEQVIKPALEEGNDVVSDRNWMSTAAYQSHGEGLSIDAVRNVTGLFLPAEYMFPAHTALLILSNELRRSRLGIRGGSDDDTFESRDDDFFTKVNQGYLAVAATLPNITCIDAAGSIEDIHEQIWASTQRVISA